MTDDWLIMFTCFLLFLACTVSGDDPIVEIIETNPAIDRVEKKIVCDRDRDVQLTCVVENKPIHTEVQWVGIVNRNRSAVTVPISLATRSYDAFKYSMDQPSPTSWRLRIQNVQVTDEGRYRCQVQVSSQNYAKAQVDLLVVDKPQIDDLESSSDMWKSEGESLTLTCQATGRPTPTLKWTRMAGELLPYGGRELFGSSLIIPVLKADDAGIYKCSASNSAGITHRDVRITVSFAPIVSSSNPVVQQAVGYVKELVCNVRGFPTPTPTQLSWTKTGSTLHFDSHIFVRNIPGASSHLTSILVFWGVREEDFGEYICTARNDRGVATLTFIMQRSPVPTADRTNRIRATASIMNTSTVITMLLSFSLLHIFVVF